jgi:hypothetical protein
MHTGTGDDESTTPGKIDKRIAGLYYATRIVEKAV